MVISSASFHVSAAISWQRVLFFLLFVILSFFFFSPFLRELHFMQPGSTYFLLDQKVGNRRSFSEAQNKKSRAEPAWLLQSFRSLCASQAAHFVRLVQRSGRSARVLRLTVNAYARPRVVPTRWVFSCHLQIHLIDYYYLIEQ